MAIIQLKTHIITSSLPWNDQMVGFCTFSAMVGFREGGIMSGGLLMSGIMGVGFRAGGILCVPRLWDIP